jgi:hypothetical protein
VTAKAAKNNNSTTTNNGSSKLNPIFDSEMKIDVLPFIYPTIGLWHKQAKLVLLFLSTL